VNTPITRLFLVVVALFAILVVFTSRWTVFGAQQLQDNPKNRRALLEEQRIHRGLIRAADGTVLARSIRRSDGTYTRRYPQNGLFAHAVGYSYTTLGRAGLEKSRNAQLTGDQGEFGSLLQQVTGSERAGDDVLTTLNPAAQRVALQQLNGRKGAVVALDPRTGAVKVMASEPGYDPNTIPNASVYGRLTSKSNQDAPLLNRSTQSGYPPGSTFKVVTAIAAIDSGRYTPDSTLNGKSPHVISGTPLSNFNNEQFGDITLTTALTQSVNTVWAQVGEKLGKETMKTYMDRLGFDAQPPLDLPSGELRASGEFRNGALLPPTSRFVDVGRMAIGQDKLNVTPLQMAMVASSVADGGRLMKPHLVDRVVDRDGRTVDRVQPQQQSRVMSASSAQKVNQMMQNVVREGSGTAAALQGIDVAGKTGTAEVDRPCGPNQLWFIAFAPAKNPKVVVAATVECGQGTGGTVAAPIAKAVMQELLK
jgi:peptidoglycan glycosyltransferase